MSKPREIKTNVMRILDKENISYIHREYPVDENDLSGSHAADLLNIDHRSLYKTIVLKGDRSGFFVCLLPVDNEIDLKKAARISGNKESSLLPLKDLLSVTGYVRGGCSPIGMKKSFKTYIDSSALLLPEIGISAGQRGQQIILSPKVLAEFIKASFEDLSKNSN